MPLMTYGGASLLVRNGAIGTSVACCCNCGVGTLVWFAWYWNDVDKICVGDEYKYYNDILAEWNKDYPIYGFDLRNLFWVGNPSGATDPDQDNCEIWGEFQIWGQAQCCPDRDCDDFYYREAIEAWTIGWDKITDIARPQFEWDPNWRRGSCQGFPEATNDQQVSRVKECVEEQLSFPYDPAESAWVLRKSIEVCCD